MTWTIQLVGDDSDLSALAESLDSDDLTVSHNGQNYILSSSRFQSMDTADTVYRSAERILELLNGAARLVLESTEAIRIGAVYRTKADGKRETIVFTKPVVIELRLRSGTVMLTHADGTVEEFHPADPISDWMPLALADNAVAKVLQFVSAGTMDWRTLYNIVEIISADVGGIDIIASSGWASKNSMVLLKRTAGSFSSVGLAARHGAEKTQPPSKPMTISEACCLVNSLIHVWVRGKLP